MDSLAAWILACIFISLKRLIQLNSDQGFFRRSWANDLLYLAHAVPIHSNIKMRFGPLNWRIASPEYNHWHHANEPDAYDRNFAAQLSISDVIAGTIFLPKRWPKVYGINEPMPQHYQEQFLHPFGGTAKWFKRRLQSQKKGDANE